MTPVSIKPIEASNTSVKLIVHSKPIGVSEVSDNSMHNYNTDEVVMQWRDTN